MNHRAPTEPVGDHAIEIALLKRDTADIGSRLQLGAGTFSRLKAMVWAALVGGIGGAVAVAFAAGQLSNTVDHQGQRMQSVERRMDDLATEQVKVQDTVRNSLRESDERAAKRMEALDRKLDAALAQKRRR